MTSVDPVHRHLFFEGIFLRYGYDFRQYSEASLDRRLESVILNRKADSLLQVLSDVLDSASAFREVLPLLTVNTSEFFRDPEFFRALREEVFPILKTYPSLRIWSAGCSTGEEVISLAILLNEDGLLERTTIHATDINAKMLKRAKEGIYDMSAMKTFAKNYAAASGLRTPSEYYTADYGLVKFNQKLLENIVFSEHNLVTDSVFIEAHLVCCRNVMIYFNRELQERVVGLLKSSLIHRGFVGIGDKESLQFSKYRDAFERVGKENIYRRGDA